MSANLLDLSGKIDALTIAIFDAIATITIANDIRFFLIGATARDLIIHYGYGIAVERATADIDLGVQVSNWTEFDRLGQELNRSRNNLIETVCRVMLVRISRTPQLMSYPTPPGLITPPRWGSVAATPPMQNPYPQ